MLLSTMLSVRPSKKCKGGESAAGSLRPCVRLAPLLLCSLVHPAHWDCCTQAAAEPRRAQRRGGTGAAALRRRTTGRMARRASRAAAATTQVTGWALCDGVHLHNVLLLPSVSSPPLTVKQLYHTLPTQIPRALAINVKIFEKS